MGANDVTIMEARRALTKIFQRDDLCDGDASPACRKALSLLAMHPQLARESFEADEEASFRFLPLSIFVASGASIDVVETVYKMYPEAVRIKHPVLKLYPLQAACEVHADDEVISFLAKQFPEAVEARDYKGDLTIHSVLNQGKDQIPRRKTVELLLDMHPQSLRETNAEGACPLGVAFRAEQGPKIIESIVNKRQNEGLNRFEMRAWKDYVLDAKDVSRLSCELFPKLKLTSFRCEPEDYTKDGFIYLMESLAADETIQELTLAFPPLKGNRSEAFLAFLQQNYAVQHLTLTRNISLWSKGSGLDTLLQGLELNGGLQSLQVSGLFLMSSFEVGHMISRAPKKLVLNAIMIDCKWRGSNSKQWGTSRVEDLTIRNCKMRGACMDKILTALTSLPDLKKLTLDFSNPEDKHDEQHLKGRDVTKPIVALLKKGQLKSLVLQGLIIDVRKLSVKLHKNRALKVLHIDAVRNSLSLTVGCLVGSFVKGNSTLEEVKFHCDYNYDQMESDKDGQSRPTFQYVEDPAITYYTDLNRNGKQASQLPQVIAQ